jgi:hypothetical protein
MSQELPSKQWSELAMFSRERMLCFVYGPGKMVLISPPREMASSRLDPVEEAVDLTAQRFRLRRQPGGRTKNIRRGLAALACGGGDADDGYLL